VKSTKLAGGKDDSAVKQGCLRPSSPTITIHFRDLYRVALALSYCFQYWHLPCDNRYQSPKGYSSQKKEEKKMATETLLLERELSVETRRGAAGMIPRGDPEPNTDRETKKNSCAGHAQNLCQQLISFFKIGQGYDWKEQYREYNEYWENYFQAHRS
jgi:hypothetical protein